MRKITVELPARELEAAMKNTGLGISDTLRVVLELYIRRAREAAEDTAIQNPVIPDGR